MTDKPGQKLTTPYLRTKIKQLKTSNSKLRSQLADDRNKAEIERKKAEKKEKEARDIQEKKETKQQEIDRRMDELKKTYDLQDINFKLQKDQYINQLRQIKNSTQQYSKMAEAAANELYKLEGNITAEYGRLLRLEEQEDAELQQQENILYQLEKQEAHLIKLLSQNTPGVPKYTPPKKPHPSEVQLGNFPSRIDIESQIALDKQIASLKQLRQTLLSDINKLESQTLMQASQT